MYRTKSLININSLIFNYVYAVVFITIYILNNNHSDYSYLYTKIFNLITTSLLLFLLLNKLIISNFKLKIKKLDFILFMLLLGIVLLTFIIRNYINFHWIYLIFAYIYFCNNMELNQRFKKIVLSVVFFSVIYQLLTLRFMEVRPVINWQDPNFSGFFLFVLFLFLKYEKMRFMSYIIFIAGFLTLSRAYILAVAIFLLLNNLSFIKSIIIRIKLNHFIIILLISLITLTFVEKYFVNSDVRFEKTMNDIDKVYTLSDASNQDRFTANILFKEELYANFFDYQFGIDNDYYTENVFMNTPHNAFYTIIINYGFYFMIFYFMIFAKIYNRYFTRQNIAIIISLFSYYMLLGSGIQGYPGILIFYLLAIKKEGKK